ncbi:MAG: fructose-1,6-bisphosphatase [Caldilineales bacterium]
MNTDYPDLRYLELLARQYPSIQAASTEIINLRAILHLPKGTEHFLSDIHGEHEPFLHVLRNGSGTVSRRIDELFQGSLMERERRELITLVYYPEMVLTRLLSQMEPDSVDDWYSVILFRMVQVCRVMSSKYTRSKVRKALPKAFAYILEELLHEQEGTENKHEYYQSIIETIISTGRARPFIVAMAELIQRLAVDHLHLIGDVYDRGPGAHIIMDALMAYHSVDFQWGNHDVVWMGAASGSPACIASVIRICLRYGNMETLQEGYGISLLPLATLAMQVYGDDPCAQFKIKASPGEDYTAQELQLMARMHKAISIIQFKLEGHIIQRRPEYEMEDRLLLHKIDHDAGTVEVDGQVYALNDRLFPTIDPANPYALTPDEQSVMQRLTYNFQDNHKLQEHVHFLYAVGSMYLVYNGNLLLHGCVPMKPDGEFEPFILNGFPYAGRALLDRIDPLVRQAYYAEEAQNKLEGQDMMWYLWTGARSPLFGKHKMATFERYFIDDKTTHEEKRNPYYDLRDQVETARRVLVEFGLDPDKSHIINGHVPVKVRKGEKPVKADGRLLVIDGGFSKAYQGQTGIAGYTLIFNSYGLLLASHQPFESVEKIISSEREPHSRTEILETNNQRIRVRDTDLGRNIQRQIDELNALLEAYRNGLIKEK